MPHKVEMNEMKGASLCVVDNILICVVFVALHLYTLEYKILIIYILNIKCVKVYWPSTLP